MTAPRGGQTADNSMSNDMVIGEMRGQLRELVHSVNNISGKFDRHPDLSPAFYSII